MLANYHDPLPGVPRVESPFFHDFFDEASPEYRIARDLHDDGFAVLDFPEPAFDEIADRIKASLEPRFDLEGWRRGGPSLRIQDAWPDNPDIRAIATNPRIIELLATLYGRPAFPFQTLNFPVGTEQHFHTDSVHFSALPERFMCGVWVALEDIGEDQGPLYYYPGSHRWPIYRNEHIGRTHRPGEPHHQKVFEPMWERLVEAHGVQPKRFMARKGQALIWAANLLHGGDAHGDRRKTRWSQVTHYLFEDCLYYTPMGSNEVVGDLFVRSPVNIVTGQPVSSHYQGRPVDSFGGKRSSVRLPPVFDPEAYLRRNPDVAAVNGDPWRHYVEFGIDEGRRWY